MKSEGVIIGGFSSTPSLAGKVLVKVEMTWTIVITPIYWSLTIEAWDEVTLSDSSPEQGCASRQLNALSLILLDLVLCA